ncbi:restriction endonuclease subunit S [Latilactobacillus sakei]|uniref:restriction endonuclease subunit S n=2 Tax=Latilactobacillus sakei TaxID=1599 RepID=UPI000E41D0A4|nr:restriction endonuclease subunit S [Latilactobacillus sakei]UNC16666.1 restriction endonuclease subunit S [Latilactobacillus sakei]
MAESLNYGLNVESREYDGRNKYIRITDINDVSRKFTPDPITSPNVDISELNDDYKLQLGDVLFARTGASVGKTYHYESSDGNLYYAGFLIRARIKTAFSSMFLHQFTWGQKYKRFVNITSQRSGQPGINAKEYGNLTLLLPNYKEQQKIGEFFRKLDRTITLQQRKRELLKKLKRGYLQQMFLAKDSVNPQLRFNEFNSNWEPYKLGEIAEIVGGGTPSTGVPEYWDGDIDWYSPTEIGESIYVAESLKKITESGLNKSSAKMLPTGTILFTSRAGIGNTAILAKTGSTNQGFQSILPKRNILDSYFIFSRTTELKKYGEITGAGSTFIEVSGKQMAQMPICIPCFEEQKKIGIFFQKLDHGITLQQSKVDKLKNLKQAYLQKLFP